MAESNTWEKREDLGNAREALEEFKGRMNIEVRKQERIDMVKERDFRRGELLGKYTAKLLYRWDDKKFEKEYLIKLEKNWRRWKNNRQIDKNKHLKSIEEKMEEENEKRSKRNGRTAHFFRGEILKEG